MTPVDFPQANATFGPPPDVDKSQVIPVRAFSGLAGGGSMDGAQLVVTAWKPTPHELLMLNDGHPVFITFVGGLPPHMVTTAFSEAIRPR